MNKIFDLHNDYLTELKNFKHADKYLHDKKVAQNLNSLVSAIWTSEIAPNKAVEFIEQAYNFVLEQNNNNSNQNLKLAIEDLHFVSKDNLYRVINASPTYCSLTWNNDNNLAGGALEGGDLSPFGIDVIRELERSNIFVDTAHLSEASFMSFSKLTEKPILCSHTACASLTPNNRNLKDYQIRMIIESNGLIGVALVGKFLSQEKHATVSDVARHIDYLVSRFSVKNVCLGTDFYGTKDLPKGIKNYNNLALLEDRLKLLGYTDDMIEDIFYKNAQQFFTKNSNL